jgi:hypothetical protein
VIGEDLASDAVEVRDCLGREGDLIDSSPGHQEHLVAGILGVSQRSSTQAIGEDLELVLGPDLLEARSLVRPGCHHSFVSGDGSFVTGFCCDTILVTPPRQPDMEFAYRSTGFGDSEGKEMGRVGPGPSRQWARRHGVGPL